MGGEAAGALSGALPTARTSVVTRVMDVLGTFSDGSTLRAVEIARRCGLPSATTHRVLQELVVHGAVSKEFGGRYSVGPRLWEIGRLGTPLYRLWSAAAPHLRALAGFTGGRTYLTVLISGEGLRLQGTSAATGCDAPCWVTERLPLHATAAGQVLLAMASKDVTDRVLHAPLRPYTDTTIVHSLPLSRLLEDVRRQGVAVSRGEHRLGETSLAAPVLLSADGVPAAVEVVLDRNQAVRQALPAVMRVAHELSQEFDGPTTHRQLLRTGNNAHPVESLDGQY